MASVYTESGLMKYGYRVANRDYVGWRVSYTKGTPRSLYLGALELIERYSERTTFKVYFNPSNPENDSVLEPGGDLEGLYSHLAFFFSLFCLCVVFAVWKFR